MRLQVNKTKSVTHSFADWINLWGISPFQTVVTTPVKIDTTQVNNKTTAIVEQEISTKEECHQSDSVINL